MANRKKACESQITPGVYSFSSSCDSKEYLQHLCVLRNFVCLFDLFRHIFGLTQSKSKKAKMASNSAVCRLT